MIASVWALLATAAAAALVEPSQDSFYNAPSNLTAYKPGAIIAYRNVPNKLAGVDYSAAYQILFRTVDALSQPIAAVTTVIIPQKPDYSKLLSYQIVYDTPDVDCSPSFTLQNGTGIDSGFTYGLSFGYIVNTPDYEGPKAAFTNGLISGQSTLDSIRAALASASFTKIQSNATIAMWGYSGGALASEWAAELQSSYAPELNIAGTALGGLTPNVSNVALSVNKAPSAGLAAAGIIGIAQAYPNITNLLNSSFVSDAAKEDFYSVKNECIGQIGTNDANKDIFGFFTQGAGILSDARVQFAIEGGGLMGIHGTPVKLNKLYVYKTTLDEISPVADTDALVEKYCKAGLTITYVKANYGTHQEEATNGGVGALGFVAGIFSGTDKSSGCKVSTVDKSGKVIGSSSIASSSTVSGTASTGTTIPTAGVNGTYSATSRAPGTSATTSPTTTAPSTGGAGFVQPAGVAALGLAVLAAVV